MTTFLTLGLLSGKCSHGANMTISVERHGEMRQGSTSESKVTSDPDPDPDQYQSQDPDPSSRMRIRGSGSASK